VIVLFIVLGISNAWDIVTYVTFEHAEPDGDHRD